MTATKVTNFLPKQEYFFGRHPETHEKYPCPYEGMEDAWVRVIPPTWGVDEAHAKYISENRAHLTTAEIMQYEIWLTFGGTNVVVDIPQKDEAGRVVWVEDANGNFTPATETIQFEDGLTYEEFSKRIQKFPSELLWYWYGRVMEVAPMWNYEFRSGRTSQTD